MDFTDLNWEQFELLVGRLLSAEGNQVLSFTRPGKFGPDLIVKQQSGQDLNVEIRHQRFYARSIMLRVVSDVLSRLDRYPPGAVLFVVSVALDTETKVQILELAKSEGVGSFDIWDATAIQHLLRRHPDIDAEFTILSNTQKAIASRLHVLENNSGVHEHSLITRLRALPPGKGNWRDYEEICVEILNHAFTPPLSPPKIQSRSEDGLDRRDALYAIRLGHSAWDTLRAECRTRFVVAEFKNYEDAPGQKEVESIQQYLYPNAMRSFGILCARKLPSDAALKQRRRAWLESQKLIVFLSDDDLCGLVTAKLAGSEPYEIIDAQLEDFFAALSP